MRGFLYSFFHRLNGVNISKKQELLLTKIFEEFYTFHEDEVEPPSSAIALLTSSCGHKLPQVLGCAINSFGANHGCFSDAAELILNDFQRKSKTYPGFGHPKYKNEDPRVTEVLTYAKRIKYSSVNINNSVEFSKKIKRPLNFGGLMACILLDCGCTLETVDLFPIVCRSVGFALIHRRAREQKIKLSSSHDVLGKYIAAD